MIKRKNITIDNIVDYMGQEKRRIVKDWGANMLSQQTMYWNKKEWEIFKKLCALTGCRVNDGITFMGIKHYKLKI